MNIFTFIILGILSFFGCPLTYGQFFPPTQETRPGSGNHGATYYKTFMLCTQTPPEYRGRFCTNDNDCKVSQLTRCLGKICCARDDVSLKALKVLKTMSPSSSNTQIAMNNGRRQNQQSQRGRQQTLPQQTVERQQTQQQQTAQRGQQIQTINEQRSKPRQPQGQSQAIQTQSKQVAIQQQNPKQQQQQQQQQQHQRKNQAPSTAQRRGQQASKLAFRSQTEPAVIPTKQRIVNDQAQNLVQAKTEKKAVADTIRSSVSLSSFPGKEGTLSAPQRIKIINSLQTDTVRELTQSEAATRRAHMRNANNPQLSVQRIVTGVQQQQQPSFSKAQQKAPQSNVLQQSTLSNVQMKPASGSAVNPNAGRSSATAQSPNRKKEVTLSTTCDDVAIIGAGISGTYAAWRLRNSNLKISVYEYSDRIGGRMFTYRFREAPDVNAELGATMYLPEKHTRMARAAGELRLPVVDFAEGYNREERILYYLREVHLRYSDLGSEHTPYNLRPAEMKSPKMLRWYLSGVYTDFSGNITNINNELFQIITNDGVPLYQQSYSEAFAKMASGEASHYLRDESGFHCQTGSTSAAVGIPAGEPIANGAPRPVAKTIATGMDAFPKTFMEEFLSQSQHHKYQSNHKLTSIQKVAGKGYLMRFRKTKSNNGRTHELKDSVVTSCAKKIILAIPKVPLMEIDWEPLQTQSIDSVYDCTVSKIYIVYDYPWWRKIHLNFTQTRSDLPTRNTFDFGISRSTGRAVLLVTYADGSDVAYWRKLNSHGRRVGWRNDANSVTEHVVNHVHIHLSYIYNISMTSIPQPRDGTMMLWDEFPFNGGWSTWKPGYKWYDVRKELLRPSQNDEVYIANGYYGTYENNMWAEGALESVDEVLSHFGLPAYA